MLKLYKYFSPDLAELFLTKPMLRVTPAFCLNDPFEVVIANDLELEFKSKVNADSDSNQIFKYFNEHLLMHGVISLSSKPDNILMWSHYAKEHKGCVVEILIDMDNKFDIFNIMPPPNSSDADLIEVKYENTREIPYSISQDNLKSIRKKLYITKFKDWSYEGEYRYIFPFSSATHLKLDVQDKDYLDIVKSLKITPINEEQKEHRLLIEDIENYWLYEQFKGFHEALFNVWINSNSNGAIFLVEVNEYSIGNIITGANSDSSKFKEIFELHDNKNIGKYYYDIFSKKYSTVKKAKLNINNYSLELNDFT